jgi:hypothetical protein
MIKIKNPRKYTIGNGLSCGELLDEDQVKEIIYKRLLENGIICEEILISKN